MPKGAKLVVYAALAGNVAIAVMKAVAFAFTSSSGMLSEAIHSAIDSADQIMLLVGLKRSQKPADDSHPFGYGMEIYFWTFSVAVLIFAVGGAASVVEGVLRILHPEPAPSPWINYLVLALSLVFEGGSLLVGWREYKKTAPEGMGVVRFIRRSKDPPMFTSILEDSAALAGLAMAALGVLGGQLGLRWADGAASVGIGLLLAGVGAVLANETRSLIAGEAAAPTVLDRTRAALKADERVEALERLRTLHVGPRSILVAADLRFQDSLDRAGALDLIRDLTRAVRDSDPRISDVFIRPVEVVAGEGRDRSRPPS